MVIFRRGQRVAIFRKSEDEGWEDYMDSSLAPTESLPIRTPLKMTLMILWKFP
jgi:hypothetical protein